jgi:uncharacterized protein (DUF2384 family)
MTSEPSASREAIVPDIGSLIEAVGGPASLSRLIGVTPRQVSRWRRGQNLPRPRNAKLLGDLHEVIARGTLLWGDQAVLMDWLTGSNTYLGQATPSDFIRLGRTAEVLIVIDEILSGAYA